MKHKEFYVRGTEVVPVLTGKYGPYARLNGFNFSERKLIDWGYTRTILSEEDINLLILKRNENEIEIFREKLAKRAAQVEQCLKSAPIRISLKKGELCETADLSGTPMIEAYRGCGKGTAYVKDGHVVAWHYGYKASDLIKDKLSDCTPVRIELSCTQICFF